MLEFFKRRRSGETVRPDPRSETEKVEQPKHTSLNDWDRKMLHEGLTNVVHTMLRDFDGHLPDTLLLPDTSARPLLYALLPVFKRLNERRGIPAPRCYFFNSKRPGPGVMLGEQFKFRGGPGTIDTKEELAAVLEDPLFGPLLETSSPEEMKRARGTMKERAREILDHEHAFAPAPRIAVLDDSVTEAATTATEIRRAFDMPDMHVYAIIAQDTDAVQAGLTVDPYDKETMNPLNGTARFSFTRSLGVGVRKDPAEHGKYSTRIPDNPLRDIPEYKARLRNEMRTIGEQVADTIEKYLSESKAA